MTVAGNSPGTSILISQSDLAAPDLYPFLGGHAVVYTHRSPLKTTVNEDCAALIPYDKQNGILVIADGLGGLPAGCTASQTAIQCLQESVQTAYANGTSLREAILDGFELANKAILDSGNGSATTLAVTEVQSTRARPYHVGDSMIMLVGQRGKMKVQSVAHSPMGYAVESGLLDIDEAVHHEERHLISNVVGARDMRIEIGAARKIATRDTLILASDGLFDNLYVDEIVNIIRKGKLEQAAQQLVELSHARMTTQQGEQPCHPDDLTFILYRKS